ncbi:MAG: head GIN domain-containing protein [Pseudomonadota bacterium]
MKRVTTAAFAATLLASAGAAAGDEDRITRTLDLEGFDSIEVSGVYDIDVRVGEEFSVVLKGRVEELDRTLVTVSGGVLDLSQDERKSWRRKRRGVDAYITLPSLNGIVVSGVVDGEIDGVDADDFEINISGVGDIALAGKCQSLDAQVSGVGDLDAEGLECSVVDIRLSGVGDASVFASAEVDARVSGMGDIDVYGAPDRVSTSDSMFAKVTVH